MNERESRIGRTIRLGKKRKGIIRSFKEEEEVEKEIFKLAHYKVEVKNIWGIDEIDVPEIAIEKKEGDKNG